MFPRLILFASDNFEAFFMMAVVGFVLFFAVTVVALLREATPKGLILAFKNILFTIIVAGEIVLMLLLGYVHWLNYERESSLTLADKALPDTRWVKDDQPVYYISENKIHSIRINGTDKKVVFESKTRIKEYYFSPDGKYMLAVSVSDLVLLDLRANKSRVIASTGMENPTNELGAAINSISWSPNSDQFCYEVSKWSEVSSVFKYYLYDIPSNKNRPIKSPTRRIPYLYWDKEGKNLYYLRSEALDTQVHGFPFEISVYKIPLKTLVSEKITDMPSKKSKPSIYTLELKGIDIYYGGKELGFGRETYQELAWTSEQGSQVGIDKKDYLYFVRNKWWRKRLFLVKRFPIVGDMVYYHPLGGNLAITHLQWLPGGKYVVIHHQKLGILILDPRTGKVGRLVDTDGYTVGWHK